METYERLLQGVTNYMRKHGKNMETIEKLETMLPSAWQAELIADAMDIIDDERSFA